MGRRYFINVVLYLIIIICYLPLPLISNGKSISTDLSPTALFTQKISHNISPEEQQKIDSAVPVKASVKPKQKRKLLVVTLNVRDGKVTKGHNSIPYANYAIKLMGDKTGAYETFFSNDTMIFKPENLNQFDAVCFNNTVGVLFGDPALRQSLLDYVYSGKGFIGIHAAGATFVQWPVYDQWPEFGEMLGGYENGGHPWKPHETITLRVDEPDHPINAAFNGQGFDVSDEVFQFQEPYSRDKLRILLTIDTDKTDMSEQRYILPERRKDKDLAISWIRNYGRGRVFYSSLGHNPHVNWDPKILRHYLDGFQFALGDLQAPAAPSNKLTPAVKAREKLKWKFGFNPLNTGNFSFFETVNNTAALGLLYTSATAEQRVSESIPKKFDYNLSAGEIKQVKKKLDSAGIRLLSYYIKNFPDDPAENRKIFEFGRRMGIEILITDPHPNLTDALGKLCNEFDIKLAYRNRNKDENPDYWNMKQLNNLCDNKSEKIGMCLDLGEWMLSGLTSVDALKTLKDRLFIIQLYDREKSTDSGDAQLTKFIQQVSKTVYRPVFFGMENSPGGEFDLAGMKENKRFFDELTVEINKK
ncbi:ThuA domain-containing protein [candidate division KSB1 bacterium]|nr:ThuA domain-containing protein [candidate division KSB1 bacterium]